MRTAAAVLAVVLPVVVLASAFSALERIRTADDRTQEANVGVVLNGKHVHRPLVAAVDGLLAQSDPEVVLLGNSIANTDFVAAVFATELGIEPRRIARLSIPNTMGAHWYAILKNRVYAAGHRPRLVVFVSDLQSLLAVYPRSEASHVALALQLGEREPVIDQKLGRRFYALERARENRTVARDRVMTWLRNRIVDLLVHHTLVAQDSRPTDEALARVFADERTNNRLHKRVIPIFNVTSPLSVSFEPEDLAPVDEGFVPDIGHLIADHGGTWIFVRPPMSPRLPPGIGDLVPAALEDAVPSAFSALGHHYLDLRAVPMNPSHFQNADHMNTEGGERFTWILTDAMATLGLHPTASPGGVDLLQSFTLVDGVLHPRRPRVSFDGAPPLVPGGRAAPGDGRGPTGFFPDRGFRFLSDVATLDPSPHRARCSPLRVREDGRLLGPANVTCEELFRLGAGRTCHAPDRLFFSASDRTDPWDNGRTYDVVLDPERACEESLWTYPKDGARIGLPAGEEARLGDGVERLVLVAADMGSTRRGGDPMVDVSILDGDRILASETFSLDHLVEGAELRFPASRSPDLAVRLKNRSDHFLLWQRMKLSGG